MNRVLSPEEAAQAQVMDAGQRHAARRIMLEVAAGHTVHETPDAALRGMRWKDVPLAVAYACEEAEVAILNHRFSDTLYTCNLKSVEDFPGSVTVRRIPGAPYYEAEATIGRFGDHTDRAAKLLASFEAHLKRLGDKRGFE